MPTITKLCSSDPGSFRLLPNSSDSIGFFDIETDGLLYTRNPVSRLWCVVIFDGRNKEYHRFDPDHLDDALEMLASYDILVGHNIIAYDIPVLQKLYPYWRCDALLLDTLVIANLLLPKDVLIELDYNDEIVGKKHIGSNSLRAWGERLHFPKGDHDEWHRFSPEMLQYCENDVAVTVALYSRLVKIAKEWDPELKDLRALAMEHDISQILMLQMATGWRFDLDAALDLRDQLRSKVDALTQEIGSMIPAVVEESVFVPKRNNKRKGFIKGEPVTRYKETPFNPGSRKQILNLFKTKYNWIPAEITEKGNPKLNDDILEDLPFPEAQLLSEYFLVQKRLSQLADGDKSWLGLVDSSSLIHGSIITNGTVSGRCSHSNPNCGQIPNSDAPYGPQCRALFGPIDGYVLLGSDAKALELRALGGYLAYFDDGDYASKVIDPDVDIHSYNQERFGVENRSIAKRLIYCVLYGGGPTKTGSIVAPHCKTEEQREIGIETLNKFYRELPALKLLKNQVESTIESRGYLVGLDGRRLHVRSSYKGLNLLLQSAGALIMKRVGIEIYERMSAAGLRYGPDWQQNAFVHDEYQMSVMPHLVDEVKQIVLSAYPAAGEFLNFRCPIEGDVKTGSNWYETH